MKWIVLKVKKGGNEKVLLTILLRRSNFMLAFLRDSNDSNSVIDIFNKLEKKLSNKVNFMNLFNVCLKDKGSKFSKPDLLEDNTAGISRTHIFYCDPRQSQQKIRLKKTMNISDIFIIKVSHLIILLRIWLMR